MSLIKTRENKLVSYGYTKTATHRGDVEFWTKNGVEYVKIYVSKNINGDKRTIIECPVADIFTDVKVTAQCEDCNIEATALITKGDHHGGVKTVCRDRDSCHEREKLILR